MFELTILVNLSSLGSGSTYIYGHCDSTYRRGMDREQCIRFVQNGKCIQRLVFPMWRVVCNAFSNVSLFWLQCDSDINYSIYREKWLENSKAGRIILIENYSVIFILQKCPSNSIQNCLLMKTVDEFWHFKSHSREHSS